MSEHETAFLLDSKKSDYSPPVLSLSAAPVMLSNTGEVRNFSTVGFDADPLGDLHVSAQLDRVATNGQPYGFKVEYREAFSVDLRRADAMVKTLRKVERGLTRIQTELGYAETFPAYLARVAKVLGIKQFGWRIGDRDGPLYEHNRYHWTDASGLSSYVDNACVKFLDTERVA